MGVYNFRNLYPRISTISGRKIGSRGHRHPSERWALGTRATPTFAVHDRDARQSRVTFQYDWIIRRYILWWVTAEAVTSWDRGGHRYGFSSPPFWRGCGDYHETKKPEGASQHLTYSVWLIKCHTRTKTRTGADGEMSFFVPKERYRRTGWRLNRHPHRTEESAEDRVNFQTY